MKSLAALQIEHDDESNILIDRIDRATKYKATRSWYPLKPASQILSLVRANDLCVQKYPKSKHVYNPSFIPEEEKQWQSRDHHYRWVENTDFAGLRTVGFADELTRIDHKGWYCDPHEFGSGELYRGIVFQLPARRGFPQYVYGYVDPFNECAASIDFDIMEGPHNGEDQDTSIELHAAANAADSMAQMFAERERDYQIKFQAEQIADVRRSEAKDKHTALREYIVTEREEIAALHKEADDLIENPWQLFA